MEELEAIGKEILDKTFTFPLGIPGFPKIRRVIFSQRSGERPFSIMRTLEDPHLAFVVIEAFYLKPEYIVDVDDADLEPIGSPGPAECLLFFIVRLESGKPFRVHANLRAPLILHKDKKMGRQVVLHGNYPEQETFEF